MIYASTKLGGWEKDALWVMGVGTTVYNGYNYYQQRIS